MHRTLRDSAVDFREGTSSSERVCRAKQLCLVAGSCREARVRPRQTQVKDVRSNQSRTVFIADLQSGRNKPTMNFETIFTLKHSQFKDVPYAGSQLFTSPSSPYLLYSCIYRSLSKGLMTSACPRTCFKRGDLAFAANPSSIATGRQTAHCDTTANFHHDAPQA